MIRIYDITPTPAPRQTQKDKWKPRACVRRYHDFRDQVGRQIKDLPPDFFHVIFLLQMPRSWSKKQRRETFGQRHLQKPDRDNLEKALVDGVYRGRDDSHVWNGASTKLWAHRGAILISTEFIQILDLPVNLDELVRDCSDVYDQSPIV